MLYNKLTLKEILVKKGRIPEDVLLVRLLKSGIEVDHIDDVKLFRSADQALDWVYTHRLSIREINRLQKMIRKWTVEDLEGLSIGEKILHSIDDIYAVEGVYIYRVS